MRVQKQVKKDQFLTQAEKEYLIIFVYYNEKAYFL